MKRISLKLGKQPKKKDPRNLKFAKYLGALPPIPTIIDHSEGITNWGMLGNDKIGDCAVVGPAHMIMAWTKRNNEYTPTMDEIIKAYSDISGYDSKTGANDNGCNMLDVLKYWKNVGIGGHKIGAFAEVDIKDKQQILAALYLFHGIDAGYQMPASSMNQFSKNKPFIIVRNSPLEGGHCMPIKKADSKYMYPVTWGKMVQANYAWIAKYMDEAYVVISEDYITGGKTLEGFDLATLTADLNLVSQ